MSATSSTGGTDKFSELLDLCIPADLKAIGNVTDTISGILTRLGIKEEKRQEVALAVQEALANAVVHGCESNPSKEIRCRLRRDSQGTIVVIVTDPGPGFSPAIISDPKRPEGLYAGGGRGVYLIRQLMDEVSFENGGNQITMKKY
ncbi:MAG TPA: ATP-binding protein [Terriglobales bacterium]|nr:ATP-binding protein [Terriglobales bacterium]